jgi:lipopolysaccharide transport system ATP-binding protein
MTDSVIQVENLSKKYILGHQKKERYTTLRDVLSNSSRNLLDGFRRKNLIQNSEEIEEFWALKDVSFEIKQGDRVGIIGRNGAGKSTLLKILSRITEPTGGKIQIKGRVASLLEVGTGFHPELTGRENISLNGAILGMGKTEIQRKFDEIVAFAEIEKFLDTPVKRYSSGMYVRLAFAVAAHLEPEILIVDEVLAVGDAKFQKKCLGKMEDVGKEGRTVLFVSHNMSTVEYLCNRGIVIQSGCITLDSDAGSAISKYLSDSYIISKENNIGERKERSGNGKVKAVSFSTLDSNGVIVPSLRSGNNFCFEIGCFNYTSQDLNNVAISLDFFDEKDNLTLLFRTNFTNNNIDLQAGMNYVKCFIDDLPLASGMYHVSIYIAHADLEVLDYLRDAAFFSVDGGDFFGTGSPGLPTHCKVLVRAKWSCNSCSNLIAAENVRS